MKNAILIVDDSRLNRETLADIYRGRGWQERSGGFGEKKR